MIKKFKVNVSKKTLINIYKKIREFPFNNIQNMDGWLHGTNHDYLKNISKYWISKFNWKLQERKINKFKHLSFILLKSLTFFRHLNLNMCIYT